jgi:hypothetical protein
MLLILTGVPQGSHLCPILFNIFMNDLPDCFLFSSPFMFADDLKLSKIINDESDIQMLQKDLDSLCSWCLQNGLKLNAKKCTHIKFTRRLTKIPSSYSLADAVLSETDVVRDLGVLFDTKLTFIPHIEQTIAKALRMVGFIIRNGREFRKVKTVNVLYGSLVRSILEYGSVIWRPHYATHSLRLERVQKRFLRHLVYSAGMTGRHIEYETRLKRFNMVKLYKRREMLELLFLFKLLHNKIDCSELLLKINFRVPSRLPRKPVTPLYPPLRRTVLGSQSPICRMSKLYNQISGLVDINNVSVNKFRKDISGLLNLG